MACRVAASACTRSSGVPRAILGMWGAKSASMRS